ncbi:MAG TPA: NUDIX hydrolase [Erysipelothrix sp.]
MRKVNLIIVFNQSRSQVLMCYRMKHPYKGLYNFVGGKVHDDEDDYTGAYRELFEETGISNKDIELKLLFNTYYYDEPVELQVYYGVLEKSVQLKEEVNPLIWIDVNEDFCDSNKYAGDGNIQHMMRILESNKVF